MLTWWGIVICWTTFILYILILETTFLWYTHSTVFPIVILNIIIVSPLLTNLVLTFWILIHPCWLHYVHLVIIFLLAFPGNYCIFILWSCHDWFLIFQVKRFRKILSKADKMVCNVHHLPANSIERLRPFYSSGECLKILFMRPYIEIASKWLKRIIQNIPYV